MSNLAANLKFAIRGIRKNPLFAAIIVLTIGLGIGANGAIFSVVKGVLFSSLPFADSDRLVFIWNQFPTIRIRSE